MLSAYFQEHYSDDTAHCYGCGRLNEHGHQLKSAWQGEESVAYFTPLAQHTAIPGYVYGGLLASLVDCHGTGTAFGALYRAENRALGSAPLPRYVTAALNVNYLKPTPLGPRLEICGRVKEYKGKKVIVEIWIVADGEITVRGEVVAVQMPAHMLGK